MKLPQYLLDLEIKKFRPPATELETDLPFNLLEPKVFEKLCCELIYKKLEFELGNEVINVLPIGVSGQKQYGADIFVKEKTQSQDKFTLYEVKRVKSYSLEHYKDTVDRFIKNYDNWGFNISEFNLFVAEDISAEDIALWQNQASKLSSKSVDYRIIPSSTINKWIRSFPELVYKYFHPAWTELLFGKSAIWHLNNYGVFGFNESSSWIGYQGIERRLYGNNLSYKNDHVRIQALLPSLEKIHASCFVEFRNGKFSHVMITLNHEQLIKEYFPSAGSPPLKKGRPYLIKSINDRGYLCDIGNCRIKITNNEANCLCDALDEFWKEYKKRIKNIEATWRSKFFNHHFNFGQDIPMIRIKRSLWSLLLDYSQAHDAFNSDGEWSIFDSNHGYIKIYTNKPSNKMEAGYHAFIKPQKHDDMLFTDFRYVDDEVVLVWQPPSDFILSPNGTVINPRYYWDAETTHNWLTNELIPEVIKWADRKTKKYINLFNKKNKGLKEYDLENYIMSYYEPYPNGNIKEIDNLEDFLFFIEKLQSFFNRNPERIYLDELSCKNLYYSLSEILLHTEFDDFSYLHGNLSYLQAKDLPSLHNAIQEHCNNLKDGCSSSFQVDCILRCILVCIRDSKNHLNNFEIRRLSENLTPLLEIMEDRMLLNRQARLFLQTSI